MKWMLLLALLTPFACAQKLSADEILGKLEAKSNSLKDASFLLTGTLFDTDGQKIALEVDAQFIPAQELAKAYFIQPDALADNFIIVDGKTVYNYLFVTNQVTILNANDPEALGGLLPQDQVQGSVNLTPNLGRFFSSDNWQATVEGYQKTPDGPVYKLRFNNVDKSANIGYVDATILDNQWLPETMNFVQRSGDPLAELRFQNYKLDTGLDPAQLRAIPPDAERIDQRQ